MDYISRVYLQILIPQPLHWPKVKSHRIPFDLFAMGSHVSQLIVINCEESLGSISGVSRMVPLSHRAHKFNLILKQLKSLKCNIK